MVLLAGVGSCGRGGEEVEAAAKKVRQILDQIGKLQPGFKARHDDGVTVSVDSQIYVNDWFQPVDENSEVYLLPYLEGG